MLQVVELCLKRCVAASVERDVSRSDSPTDRVDLVGRLALAELL